MIIKDQPFSPSYDFAPPPPPIPPAPVCKLSLFFSVYTCVSQVEHGGGECCGSMTFRCGSGSGSVDPCLWLMDPDPAIFLTNLQDANKKLFFLNLSAYYFLKVYLHHFSKIKSQKESQNNRNQGFSDHFCMMIEVCGYIPLTNGSGSGRPKNMWIRWIRIRIRKTGWGRSQNHTTGRNHGPLKSFNTHGLVLSL